jgi:NAD(P)-dependent dehydrogenase (short-subunit alcohol dehydrogenase family)
VKHRSRRIDFLVNNAAINEDLEGLLNAEIHDITLLMETDFYGSMRVTKAFLPLLKKSDDGRIINVSSGMGALDDLVGGYAGYRLLKAGLNAQTIVLANKLKGSAIKAFAMCPGWVRTDMGGTSAPRSVEEGADTVLWLATAKEPRSGGFYRNRREIPW